MSGQQENKKETAASTTKNSSKPVKPCCALSNGLTILNVKRQEGDIAVLTATDFIQGSAKLFFDRSAKQLIANPFSIRLNESDGKKLDDWLKN